MNTIIDKSSKYNIYLASQSPRRIYLLKELGLHFNIASFLKVDEAFPQYLNDEEIAIYLSEKKSDVYSEILKENRLLITADTIVICDGKMYGKPQDQKEAFAMLKNLSNKMHIVYTAVTLKTINKKHTFFEKTNVWFKNLYDDEINYYIDKFKPFDKAGAYGIQEWIGYVAIEKIEGCFFNVMGFPTSRFIKEFEIFDNENFSN